MLSDISDGVFSSEQLGKRLLSYVVSLSREAALLESSFDMPLAYQKYLQSQFVCNELLRDLNNTLKFSNEYLEEPSGQLTSFTFIEEQGESMFDLRTEKVLQSLLTMMEKRMQVVKASPYFDQ